MLVLQHGQVSDRRSTMRLTPRAFANSRSPGGENLIRRYVSRLPSRAWHGTGFQPDADGAFPDCGEAWGWRAGRKIFVSRQPTGELGKRAIRKITYKHESSGSKGWDPENANRFRVHFIHGQSGIGTWLAGEWRVRAPEQS